MPTQALAAERRELGDEPADVLGAVLELAVEQDPSVLRHRGDPVYLLRGVDADADPHVSLPFVCLSDAAPLGLRQRPNQRSIAASNQRSGKRDEAGGHAT